MAVNAALQKMLNATANKYKGGGDKAQKMPEGRTVIRLIFDENGMTKGRLFGEADLGVHWIKADEKAKPLSVIGDCEIVYQKPSVVKTAIELAVENAIDDESKKLFESWKARRSVIVPAIVRPATDEMTLIELTSTTFGKIVDLVSMYSSSDEDLLDLVSGKDIVITRTGKGLNTSYDVAVAPGASKPVPAEVLTRIPSAMDYIEREFFRGEEQAALNAIAQIAGIPVPRLGGPTGTAGTATTALNSPAKTVEDATVETVEPPAPAPEVTPAPVATPKPAATAPVDDAIAKQIAALQAQQAELLATQAAAATTPSPAATASETTANALSPEDADAILAELADLK